MAKDTAVRVDIPCDVQQIDDTGLVWTFLHEARDPSVIRPGAIVITADEDESVLACVIDLVPQANGTVVHLQILPGDPLEYAEALSRAHLLTA